MVMKMALGAITGGLGQQHGRVRIQVDSHICTLFSTLRICTAISKYTQLFGMSRLGLKS